MMEHPKEPKLDEIGHWSEVKLEIIRKYAAAYSKVLSGQKKKARFTHLYIDGFAGAGLHISRQTGDPILGSPLQVLSVQPPFDAYHFVELDPARVVNLRMLAAGHANVNVHEGDCNEVLRTKLFPGVQYRQFRRAFCLLDPYGLRLHWEVMRDAGRSRAVDLLLNFPIMDMNRRVLWSDPDRVDKADADRMTAFWGDDSWRRVAYRPKKQLGFSFAGGPDVEKEPGNDAIVDAFRARLKTAAGFPHVAEPLPMRNSVGFVVYYLFLASQKQAASDIITGIFKRYRKPDGGTRHG